MDERTVGLIVTGSARRAPLPASMPRSEKRFTTRHSPRRVTAHIRVFGAALDDEQREYVARKLGMKLGKFASSIERVSVRVTDINGPRGGADQRCRIKVVLSGLPSVVVERQHATREAAIDRALRATEESVRRIVRRRRMKALHRWTSRKHAIAA